MVLEMVSVAILGSMVGVFSGHQGSLSLVQNGLPGCVGSRDIEVFRICVVSSLTSSPLVEVS
jgi:hypothetical protein